MIQSLQNPFRDWNESAIADSFKNAAEIQSLQNPFRDWNLEIEHIAFLFVRDSKPPKPF